MVLKIRRITTVGSITVIVIVGIIISYSFFPTTPQVRQDTNIVISGNVKSVGGNVTKTTYVGFLDVANTYGRPVALVPVNDNFYTAELPNNHDYKIVIQYTMPSLGCQQTVNGCVPLQFACDAGILNLNTALSNLQKDVKC